MNACPTQQQLHAFATGTLAEETADVLLTHLETCTDCRSTLNDRNRASGRAAGEPRPLVDAAAILNNPAFQRAVAEVRQFEAVGVGGGDVRMDEVSRQESLDLVGRQLDQYRVIAKIGEGGMGVVYKAVHVRLDKVVALKVLSACRFTSPERVARFEREMLTVGRIQSPHIVGATDAREIDGLQFLVMEYLDGVDLAALVERASTPLIVADACEMIRQAAIGLHDAHQHDLIHRDVKPSNLLLTTEGRIKILDLGLALAQRQPEMAGPLTGTDQIMGTIDYMSPEQIGHSHEVDLRADLYGLGCTLFKLLTGKTPFHELNSLPAFQRMKAHVEQPAPSVTDLRSEVLAELAAIVDRLLAKDPNDRFPDAEQLARALEPFCTGADLIPLIRQAKTAADQETVSDLDRLPTMVPAAEVDTGRKIDDPRKQERKPTASPPTRRSPVAMIGVAAAIVVLLAATVFYLATNKGNVVVKSFDPSIEIIVKRSDRVVDEFEVRSRNDATSYYVGEYEIEFKGGQPNGTTIKNQTFTLKRDKTVLVEIIRLPNPQASDSELAGQPAKPENDRPVAKPAADPDARPNIPAGGEPMPASLREAVRRIHRVGGVVSLHQNAGEHYLDVRPGEALPVQHFTVARVYLAPPFFTTPPMPEDVLRGLSSLTTLNSLDLSATGMDDRGLELITDLPQLRELALNQNDLSDAAMAHLASFKALSSLELEGTRVTDAGMQHFSSLVSLKLNKTKVGDAGLEALRQNTHMRILFLRDTQVTDAGAKHFQAFPDLQQLDLRGTAISDVGLMQLWHCESLHSLELSGPHISGHGVEGLMNVPNLKRLTLSSFNVASIPLSKVSKIKNLESLSLIDQVTDDGVKHLQELTELRELRIGGIFLSDEGLKELAKIKPLRTLYVASSIISDEGIPELEKLPELRSLTISSQKITDAGADALSKLTQLQSLSLTSQFISTESVGSVAEALPKCAVRLNGVLVPAPVGK